MRIREFSRSRAAVSAVAAGALALVAGCGAGGRPAQAAQASQTHPGAQAATPPGDSTAPARVTARAAVSACVRPGAARRANATLRSAERRYADEAGGSVIHADIRRIGRDRVLLADLSAGRLQAALGEANSQLTQHVVRIRVVRGTRVLVDANPTSFDVAGASLALHGRGGRALGRLEITIQDVIGFIKLNFRHDGAAATVVRAQGGRTRTNLPAAARAPLPPRGCTRVAGRAFVVRSFQALSFTGEPLTIWLLTNP